jgi:transposase
MRDIGKDAVALCSRAQASCNIEQLVEAVAPDRHDDAEAICEAVVRPNMRRVETKTAEEQSCVTLHRTRHLFVSQQNTVLNSIRAHLAEFGLIDADRCDSAGSFGGARPPLREMTIPNS